MTAFDPHVAPARLLPGHAQDQSPGLGIERRASRRPLRASPLARHESSVPAKQRLSICTRRVAYEVASQAVDQFQRAVRRVGRDRRRTDAVRWSVYCDAEAPQRFVEMFITPSWQEPVRQHERRTLSDAALQDSLRALLRATARSRR